MTHSKDRTTKPHREGGRFGPWLQPWCLAVVSSLLILNGCRSGPSSDLPDESFNIHHFTLAPITSDPATRPTDSRSHRRDLLYVYLDLYRLRVPFGAISADPTFWKKVDEDSLNPSQRQVLFRNGIRMGIASVDQWDYFKGLIDLYPSRTQKSTLTGGDGQGIEIPFKNGVAGQTIFYFDRDGRLHGRSYDSVDDLLAVHFQPSVRAWANVRISLCPILRATRRRLEYTAMNNAQEVQYTTPETLYDLGLVADLAPGEFLILAPSPQAIYPTRLGHLFLVEEEPSERYEQLLLIVPHVYRAKEQHQARR